MTGLDTNILVRFFTRDDPTQLKRAKSVLGRFTPASPGFVSLVCLIELVWVLRTQYRLDKAHLIGCLENLLDSPELMLENEKTVAQALQRFAAAKADFADCLIERVSHHAGCTHTVTFDVGAARMAGMKLI